MRDGPSPPRAVAMSLVLTCLLLPISTGAELATDERLAEEGLTSSPCETTPLTATRTAILMPFAWWLF